MAGEITRLWPGARPGPWRTFADKPVIPPDIDRGSTRITALRPGGYGPYRVFADKAPSSPGTARPDTQITKIRPGRFHGAVYTITDKAPSVADNKAGADTYVVYMSLSNTSTVVVAITDTYRPVLTLSGNPQITIPASDTYRPVLTLANGGITTGSPTLVSRSDTYRPVLTLAQASLLKGEWYTASDTYIPVLALATGTLSKEDIKTGSDTYVPVLSFGFTLTPHTFETVPVQDTYTVRLTLAGTPSVAAADVDNIVGSLKPTGQITGKWI